MSFASSLPVPLPTLALKVVPAVVEIVNSFVPSIDAVELKVIVPVAEVDWRSMASFTRVMAPL